MRYSQETILVTNIGIGNVVLQNIDRASRYETTHTRTFGLIQSLAFWWGNVSGMAGAFTEFLLTFTLYPEAVFPSEMRWVFYSLVPAGFLAFLPVTVLKTLDWVWLPVVIAAAAFLCALNWLVFQAGLKRYESGNAIGARI